MKKLLFAAMFLCSIVAMAQQQSTPMKPGRTAEGIYYYLPKTAIRITLQIEKTTYKPGEFCKYSEKYLRIKDVSSTPSTKNEKDVSCENDSVLKYIVFPARPYECQV